MAPRRVSPREAETLLGEGYIYLDVRSELEFEQAHPEGSVNVPLLSSTPEGLRPNPEFLQVVEANFPTDAKLVVGCQSGSRSAQAAQVLERAGYANVVEQRCGLGGARDSFGRMVEPGWVAEGLPIRFGSPEGRSYADLRARLK